MLFSLLFQRNYAFAVQFPILTDIILKWFLSFSANYATITSAILIKWDFIIEIPRLMRQND